MKRLRALALASAACAFAGSAQAATSLNGYFEYVDVFNKAQINFDFTPFLMQNGVAQKVTSATLTLTGYSTTWYSPLIQMYSWGPVYAGTRHDPTWGEITLYEEGYYEEWYDEKDRLAATFLIGGVLTDFTPEYSDYWYDRTTTDINCVWSTYYQCLRAEQYDFVTEVKRSGYAGDVSISMILSEDYLAALNASPTFMFEVGAESGTFDGGNVTFEFEIEPLVANVPEPSTWVLMIGGVSLAGAAVRRRKPAAA